MKKLSELVKEQAERDRKAFLDSEDKDVNYYYIEKQKRIKEGKEEILILNEDEEGEN